MSFQSGLSGLNAASRNLDVIGHNVANSNTVGAKAARTEFADLYASSLAGAGSSFNGIGVTVADVDQQFTQGDIASSSNPLDMAINGAGFFRLDTNGTMSYSRNGQFKVDKDGYIVNAQGAHLTGYQADVNGQINVGVPQDLKLNSRDTSPKSTVNAVVGLNLDARSAVPAAPFNINDSSTYAGATSLTGAPRCRSSSRAAWASCTTICNPLTEPGAISVSPVPMAIEHAEPGGVSCTKRRSGLTW